MTDDDELHAPDAPSSALHPRAAPPPHDARPPEPRHPAGGPSGEPLGLLDYQELPEAYGVDECEVLFKDPFWVFTYWEVTDGGLASARAQLGPSAADARLVLRLFSTLGGGRREVHDVDLAHARGRRYLPAVRPGIQLRVAVGMLSPEGYFAPIAHSSLIRVPWNDAAPPARVEWMAVAPARGRDREPLALRRLPEHGERALPRRRDPASRGGSSPGAK